MRVTSLIHLEVTKRARINSQHRDHHRPLGATCSSCSWLPWAERTGLRGDPLPAVRWVPLRGAEHCHTLPGLARTRERFRWKGPQRQPAPLPAVCPTSCPVSHPWPWAPTLLPKHPITSITPQDFFFSLVSLVGLVRPYLGQTTTELPHSGLLHFIVSS